MNPDPLATYRVQLHSVFGFEQAIEVIPYLAELGVSHLYASPCLQAGAGSTHGYDVVDPTRVNDELGGEEAHAKLCKALLSAGLGQIIDVVPNHMAIAGKQNPWWWDVLENGPSSRYATYFDVDWNASGHWPGKILLAVLGDHYGRILEDGQLRLNHQKGEFALHYYDHSFPVEPGSLADLLGRAANECGSATLAFLAQGHADLPPPGELDPKAVERRRCHKSVLANWLARLCREVPEADECINAETARMNDKPDEMHALIDRQNYRLAFWRAAAGDLNYRRFFDITELVGLRVEEPAVFQATHALPIAWVQKGWVQGLRIDHPDGLWDPAEYFHRLREACPDAWIVAEKILKPHESLPSDWPVAGTTGYDFLNRMNGLFIDSNGEDDLTRFYEEFTGTTTDYQAVVVACKRLALTDLLSSDINRLCRIFVDVCEKNRCHRDYTRQELHAVLYETAVHFPVYRSYVSASKQTVHPDDDRHIEQAINAALAARPDLNPELFCFLKDLLLLRVTGSAESELVMRFQQLTGPVMAKGVEDTAFYRYHRLVALNEVGGDPSRFGHSLAVFHKGCAEAQASHPFSMLASSTHDTKRSEDVRARLALLSEMPARWMETVGKWASLNARHRQNTMPDRHAEYLFYQTIAGAWPITRERIAAYMQKAVREAKMHTSWLNQNETYEQSLADFITAVMQDEKFLADLEGFVAGLIHPGRINSLAQTLIKLTAPGIPDIYQGTELWSLRLVDPDNRAPVDYALRRRMLNQLSQFSPEEIMDGMDDGLPKMWVIRQALHLRRRRPDCFGRHGQYRSLAATGKKAGHLVAYERGESVITLTPRHLISLEDDWNDTEVQVPIGKWQNILTGDEVTGGAISLRNVFSRFPVGLLERKE